MPLVTPQELLLDAQKNKYAIGAFNIENMEMAQGVIAAAEELRAPVIMQTTPSTIRYASVDLYYANVWALAKSSFVPVVLHLDHGDSFALAMQAIRAGYTSVMFDGSAKPFEENIEITKRVVEAAGASGLAVEAELGKVGGKEDDLSVKRDEYTDPAQAKEFVERTGVSLLAIAIGTAHGVYSGTPVLDVNRLSEIRKIVDVPLVLHGASGLSEKDIRECIARGACKVNFATDLRIAFTDGMKSYLEKDPKAFDPKKFGKAGRENVIKATIEKMKICGCINRV